MTTPLSLALMTLIIGFFVLDAYVLHMDAAMFLGKKLLFLIEYMAFWR